ncbi:uncharacterized protein LOC102625212 isoform X2 [Citrus sinensis]|uniref:uncharacterized protein LOC102625212 isoform X2 n=1 Tax=Citrus sinensis TaxID=2711 RepID=UPI002277AC83|nr:uncharacterized protein LOC102625212 isoform X2 [Citrus sinensis]
MPHSSVIKCPYFTKFSLTIETVHKADNGRSDNVHNLSEEQLAARQVEVLDIASTARDYWSYAIASNNVDFSKFKSKRTGRGPLSEGWQGERALFLESHRNCFGWIDEWFGMTMQQIREIEQQSGSSLNERLGKPTSMTTKEGFESRCFL